jgi:hypothetical protein
MRNALTRPKPYVVCRQERGVDAVARAAQESVQNRVGA